MTETWRICRVTGENFADCLKKAWRLYKLGKAMKARVVQFFYQKVNGEVRQAFGTLQDSYIAGQVKGVERKQNDLLFTYWDTEKESFRSFKKFNIINIA